MSRPEKCLKIWHISVLENFAAENEMPRNWSSFLAEDVVFSEFKINIPVTGIISGIVVVLPIILVGLETDRSKNFP